MSPQGLQAQALVAKAKGYDPKRDTRNKSLWKFYQKQAAQLTQSGVLPENERHFFSKQFSGMFAGAAQTQTSARRSTPARLDSRRASPVARLQAARMAA